jgi:hypothetical protein
VTAVVDLLEHTPTRPGWSCSACLKAWPCAPAKVQLSEQYVGNVTALRIYAAQQMWDAIDDSTLTALGPSPYGLRERFLDWIDALETNGDQDAT